METKEERSLKKILIGPSADPLFKKICIYLSYQHSGLNLREIGEYFGMQRSAVSQLSRRFAETLNGHQELKKVLSRIAEEGLLNVAA